MLGIQNKNNYKRLINLNHDLQNDYKLAIQIHINEQRRQSRLNQKIRNMEKFKATLEERARQLLSLCQEPDGHEPDLSYFQALDAAKQQQSGSGRVHAGAGLSPFVSIINAINTVLIFTRICFSSSTITRRVEWND